jgi:uncharacterized delta-60 repeat protein
MSLKVTASFAILYCFLAMCAFSTPTVPSKATQQALEKLQRDYPGAVFDIDPLTGTLRSLTRWQGGLSAKEEGSARNIAERWLRANHILIGLQKKDLATLKLSAEDKYADGDVRLQWTQSYRGVPTYDNTLTIYVQDNQISAVSGSPLCGLQVASIQPKISAARAIELAAALIPGPASLSAAANHKAQLVLFNAGGGSVVLAWLVTYSSLKANVLIEAVIDAQKGYLLKEENLVAYSRASVWDFYPGAAKGGDPHEVDLSSFGLLNPDGILANKDFQMSIVRQKDREPVKSQNGDWREIRRPFASPEGLCKPAGCSWDHTIASSVETNLKQAAVQAFYFLNRFNLYLANSPINFRRQKTARHPIEVMLDVSEEKGLPQRTNQASAGVYTRDNGDFVGRLLFRPYQTKPRAEFSDVLGSEDATIVMHEFMHIVVEDLNPNLRRDRTPQSKALEEGLADWYAMGFLMKFGLLRDTDVPGELHMGEWVNGKPNITRTEPLDCTIGAPRELCPRNQANPESPGQGGYSYANYGLIHNSGTEEHADGEIISQTLFELRRVLIARLGEEGGTFAAESLVTEAIRRLPASPSFLDLRNAILAANIEPDLEELIWEVFRRRDMGAQARYAEPMAPPLKTDRTFGKEGVVEGPEETSGLAVVVQRDGKIVVLGTQKSGEDVTIHRFESDGSPDYGFGYNNGASGFGPDIKASALAIQPDGKIIIGGSFRKALFLKRLSPEGKVVEADFGRIAVKDAEPSVAKAIAIDVNGNIFVAGSIGHNIALWRIQPDGNLDQSFGVNGVKRFPKSQGEASSMVLQPDGKIVVVGSSEKLCLTMRLFNDGRLDPSFGKTGTVALPPDPQVPLPGKAVAMDAAGNILTACEAENKSSIVRMTGVGVLDPHFTPAQPQDFKVRAIAVQPDGKIVFVGASKDSLFYGRLNNDGTKELARISGRSSVGNSVALQADGKIVVVGTSAHRSAVWRFNR